ncbi:hypothetical protein DITRI_Ditri16bG0096300 [Diplodiscus trichospermus]
MVAAAIGASFSPSSSSSSYLLEERKPSSSLVTFVFKPFFILPLKLHSLVGVTVLHVFRAMDRPERQSGDGDGVSRGLVCEFCLNLAKAGCFDK